MKNYAMSNDLLKNPFHHVISVSCSRLKFLQTIDNLWLGRWCSEWVNRKTKRKFENISSSNSMDKQGIEPWTLRIHHFGGTASNICKAYTLPLRYMPISRLFGRWFLMIWCQNRILNVCNIAQKLFSVNYYLRILITW